ncbi:MAG: S49 family peptidase [Micavibrio sp.]
MAGNDIPDEIDAGKSRWARYLDEIPFIGDYLNPRGKIAIIRMAGVIADNSVMRRAGINYQKFREVFEKAFETPRLRALVLVINSPGGAPAQCSLIASQIRTLAADKNIPVYAFIEDVAASGGYWLSCAADEIYAQETSIVGSIGVISSGFGLDGFIARHAIERRIHTAGRDKSFLDPFRPEKPEDVSRLRALQDSMHENFKSWVKERRGTRLGSNESELLEGAFWTGGDALALGLIDGIGDYTSVMKEKFGEDIRFKYFTPDRKTLLSGLLPFGGESRLASGGLIDAGALIDAAEEKTFWGRFGL